MADGTGEFSRPRGTSIRVREALGGNAESLEWVSAHFSAVLRAHAEYRLTPRLRALASPDDLVQEVWQEVLPRLALIRPRRGRLTPPLVKYMSRTLLHKIAALKRQLVRRRLAEAGADAALASCGPDPRASSPSRAARRDEASSIVTDAMSRLPALQREIVILRGLEQHPPREIAVLLGIDPRRVSLLYHRAVAQLREALPESAFDELAEI